MTGMTGKRVKLRSSGLGLNIFSFVSLAASYERSEEMGEEKVQKDSESWKKDGEHRYLTAPVITQRGIEAGDGVWLPLAATANARDSCVKHETEHRLGQRKGCHGYLRMLNKGLLVFPLHPVPFVLHSKIIFSCKAENVVCILERMPLSCPWSKVWDVSMPGMIGICVHAWYMQEVACPTLQKEPACPFSFRFCWNGSFSG